jgi:threonine/homoserine efflux transporter RhtA
VIYSVDPAIAAVVGLVALSQALSLPQIVGMTAVIAASAGATASTSAST